MDQVSELLLGGSAADLSAPATAAAWTETHTPAGSSVVAATPLAPLSDGVLDDLDGVKASSALDAAESSGSDGRDLITGIGDAGEELRPPVHC